MVAAGDVFAGSGVKLLAKGVQLQANIIDVLVERNATDPILGGVPVVTDWALLYGE